MKNAEPSESRRTWIKGSIAALATPSLRSPVQAQGKSGAPRRPRIKIGQIGVGHGHATKLSVYRQSDAYEVVGIVEEDERLREEARGKDVYRGIPWMTHEQLLNTPGLQAVLVETRVRDLLNTAELCVNAGLHVHLDKPAGESLSQYQRILETASKKNRWVQMGYMFRYNPAVLLLREVLAAGWLGDVFEAHAVMSKQIGVPERDALAGYRGGMMFELGCHVIDLIVGLLGAPSGIVPFARHSAARKDGLLDNMLAVFEYPRATATVRSSAVEVEGFARRHLVICGTEGTFHIQPLDDPSARVAFSTAHGSYRKGYQDLSFPKFTRYVADAAAMAAVIREEKPIDFGPQHDMLVQRTVLLASGLPVDG